MGETVIRGGASEDTGLCGLSKSNTAFLGSGSSREIRRTAAHGRSKHAVFRRESIQYALVSRAVCHGGMVIESRSNSVAAHMH